MSETNPPMRRYVTIAIVALVLIAAGYSYVRYQEMYPSTDDAYIHGNLLYIAPQVNGILTHVYVSDFAHVDEGEVIAQIDPALYQTRFDEAKAAYEVALTRNKAGSDAISAASADVNSATANLDDVQNKYQRDMKLVEQGMLSKQLGDDLRAQLSAAKSALDAARARMRQLINQQGAEGTEAPEVKQAAAALSAATLNLSYTQVVAPVSGRLGSVKVKKGSVVAAGQAMMPIIQDNTFWVQANYKEGDVGRLVPNMKAQIVMDMYPDVVFEGKIEAISPASGSSFSLLPPENATGNWVKVPQRFPVRLSITSTSHQPILRVGANVSVTVNTREMQIFPTTSEKVTTDDKR